MFNQENYTLIFKKFKHQVNVEFFFKTSRETISKLTGKTINPNLELTKPRMIKLKKKTIKKFKNIKKKETNPQYFHLESTLNH
jgi:transcription initiation factor IIE alpha subunit